MLQTAQYCPQCKNLMGSKHVIIGEVHAMYPYCKKCDVVIVFRQPLMSVDEIKTIIIRNAMGSYRAVGYIINEEDLAKAIHKEMEERK